MLREPELRDAYENLKKYTTPQDLPQNTTMLLVDLRTTTLLLLRAVDSLGARYSRDLHEVRDLLTDNAQAIREALSLLRRN